MITGNEPFMPITEKNGIYGLTIFQELSARFMVTFMDGNFERSAQYACQAADALINEWNNRSES